MPYYEATQTNQLTLPCNGLVVKWIGPTLEAMRVALHEDTTYGPLTRFEPNEAGDGATATGRGGREFTIALSDRQEVWKPRVENRGPYYVVFWNGPLPSVLAVDTVERALELIGYGWSDTERLASGETIQTDVGAVFLRQPAATG